MNAYTGLAGCYDGFTGDVDYDRWLRWYLRWFRQERTPVETVLDLACGTGTLTCLLAREGYDVIGADGSPEMLAQAMDKALSLEEERRPLLLCQEMEELELAAPVDACVCSLDSLNYLTGEETLEAALASVAQWLRPGGLFLFDVIPVWEFARRDGAVYVDEDEDALCLWRADYDPSDQTIAYGLDLFQRQRGELWSRVQEEHLERGWDLNRLETLLGRAELDVELCYGTDLASPPGETDSRVFFVCRRRRTFEPKQQED
ncbi:MAG: class I SAM-dependent methyltransferase [Clostridiales bacterium]|nr:class I SAM-dependent methyltransferase [Clostridiales bacterium]